MGPCTKALLEGRERAETRPIGASSDGRGRYSLISRASPLDWTADGANRNDSVLLAPTLNDAAARGLLGEIETIWLDRGYDSDATRERLAERDIDDAIIAKKQKRGSKAPKKNQPMGLRWPVERTNSWLSNFGHYAESRIIPTWL